MNYFNYFLILFIVSCKKRLSCIFFLFFLSSTSYTQGLNKCTNFLFTREIYSEKARAKQDIG